MTRKLSSSPREELVGTLSWKELFPLMSFKRTNSYPCRMLHCHSHPTGLIHYYCSLPTTSTISRRTWQARSPPTPPSSLQDRGAFFKDLSEMTALPSKAERDHQSWSRLVVINFPLSFPNDCMHLASENIIPLLYQYFGGSLRNHDKKDFILKKKDWKKLGRAIAAFWVYAPVVLRIQATLSSLFKRAQHAAGRSSRYNFLLSSWGSLFPRSPTSISVVCRACAEMIEIWVIEGQINEDKGRLGTLSERF